MLRATASRRLLLLLIASHLSGCASETLLRSNFDATPSGQPPSVTQPVGTAHVDAPNGVVVVVDPPVTPSPKWVEVSRPNGQTVAGLQGKLAHARGDGRYSFTTTMFMSATAGVATIQFEPARNGASDLLAFLHIDFTEDNKVRINDDDSTKFGQFVRGEPFLVQVDLNISSTGSTARIAISGAKTEAGETSGQANHTITGGLQGLSREFGAIRIWQGFPHVGAFQATNIVVKRRT